MFFLCLFYSILTVLTGLIKEKQDKLLFLFYIIKNPLTTSKTTKKNIKFSDGVEEKKNEREEDTFLT